MPHIWRHNSAFDRNYPRVSAAIGTLLMLSLLIAAYGRSAGWFHSRVAVGDFCGGRSRCVDGAVCLQRGQRVEDSLTAQCYRRCTADSNCSGGEGCVVLAGDNVCARASPEGGSCSQHLFCPRGTDCMERVGDILTDAERATGTCFRACTDDSGCTEGRVCRDMGGSHRCVEVHRGHVARSTPSVRQLALGDDHSCALLVDGTALCWGANTEGRLGDGSTTDRQSPTIVSGLANARQLAAGRGHTCALLNDGTVRCWGDADHGQILDVIAARGALGHRTTPVGISGLSDVAQVASASLELCARHTTGAVTCWGSSRNLFNAPSLQPMPLLNHATDIVGGGGTLCARFEDGLARCWGDNDHGHALNGSTNATSEPAPVVGLTAPLTSIVLGREHACAIVDAGHVQCWGANDSGQLGNGTRDDAATPQNVPGLEGVTAIALGEHHSCVLLANGSVRCWGSNESGQLGDHSDGFRGTPGPVPGLTNVTEIAAGSRHMCARTSGGSVSCWGSDERGQCGDGTSETQQIAEPVAVAW